MDALRSEAFSLLKPFCVTLTKEHSRENIAKLFTALQSVDILFLQDLQEYVIFPLRVILKHPKKCSQDLYLDLYMCMEYVLGHTKVTRWDLFQDIFHNATTMLSCPTDQSKVATLSEELKIAIIQTLRTLVKNSEYSSMKDSVPQFLEILVSLIGDDMAKVASGSRHALELFSQSQAVDQQHHLTEILEENLHTRPLLPRDRLQSIDLKYRNNQLPVWRSGGITHEAFSIVRPRKYFKHFNNDRIFQKVQGVCHLLGYYGDIHLLIDHFLDIFHESSMFKLQATLVINEIMLGTTGELVCTSNTKNGKSWNKHSRDEIDSVIRMLVDEYLNPINFDLVTSVTGPHQKVQSLEQQLRGLAVTNNSHGVDATAAKMNRNIVQIALYLEGFGNFSKVLKSNFERFLIHVLYPMLEKLGDQTAYISNAAFIALWDVCTACRYKSLDELIRNNSDYLMNAISLRLRHLDRNRKCPLVLKVMLQYSSAELLPLIDDTVYEILESLDDNYAEESVLFMGVLNELSKAVVRWFPEQCACTNNQVCKCGNQSHSKCHSQLNSKSPKNNSSNATGEEQIGSENVKGIAKHQCHNKEIVTKSSETGQKNISEDVKNSSAVGYCNCSSSHTTDGGSEKRRCTCEFSVTQDNSCMSIRDEAASAAPKVPDRIGRGTEELKSYFSNLLKLESEARGEFTEDELQNFSPDPSNTKDDISMETDEEKKPPLPHHVTAVKEVMLRCKHIISSRNPRLRLLVLDTISHTCTALKPYQDELLPLIHQIWPSFSLCFADEEKLVIVKALDVLQVIARSAGDFVKHRITKDILPKLSTFLNNQAQISVHAGSAYQFTVNYKLQLAILKHISPIAKLTSIEGSDLDIITTSCMPYLHVKQPATLQNACIECCKELIQIDADLMWLKLCSVYCPKSYIPPGEQYSEIKSLKQSSSSNAYTGNVTKLMTECGLL
ncbi:TELO2-interacting protein 1 homolog [Mercenaria mercenaria]|uniref:TELO2-interacting protein 1 homolog n=1 Tax=Mercenaria mercenaria TaxID=6596 RepID=UPI00234F548E|nr:TELO2-interacting protein 1 homolog [Mercenaria mercenaria]